MAIEVGYVLPAGSWVSQDKTGDWYAYSHQPTPGDGLFNQRLKFGSENILLARKEQNHYWQSTLHQIQPGEVIYLSD